MSARESTCSSTLRLTPPQRDMLSNAVHGRALTYGLTGRASHGGATGTRAALVSKGLLDAQGNPTPAGRAVFAPRVPA